MTPCISPLWIKASVPQKLLANGLHISLVTYRCGVYGHFAQECPNPPSDDEMGQSDSEQSSIQMLTCENPLFSFSDDIEHLNL